MIFKVMIGLLLFNTTQDINILNADQHHTTTTTVPS